TLVAARRRPTGSFARPTRRPAFAGPLARQHSISAAASERASVPIATGGHPLLPRPLGASGGDGGERVGGPWVARVAAAHFGLDGGVTAAPKTGEVARVLHRPVRRRKEPDHQRHAPARNRRVAGDC